ncbi:MAG: hypothetical protein RLZZ488_1413 [Pseudomonadota bacterium]
MKKPVLFSLLIGSGVLLSNNAFAFRQFLGQFTEHYDANSISTQNLTDEQSCGLCHVRAGGGGRRTPYGEDFKSVGLNEGKGFPGIEFLDSDKDGFVNLEEIFLQTAPGKAESAPAGRVELQIADDSTLRVTPSVACTTLTLKAFGFSLEAGLSDLELSNVVGETKVKISGEKGAVLARCEAESLAGSLLR